MDNGRILVSGSPPELVRAHVEPEVLEVYGPGVEQWLSRRGRNLCRRTEQVGETVFCYAADERPLLDDLHQHPQLHFLHRPANLEDVFVKLTGRELRDG
jgi:lipooligosaccharide transport system ATP-binding protein